MKKVLNEIVNKIYSMTAKTNLIATRTKMVLSSNSGEGFFDSGIKVLIVVVVGGLLLVSFYALWKNNLIPTITTRIEEMFDYSA